MTSAIADSTLRRVRTMLGGLLALGLSGLLAELWLLGHVEEWRQWLPIAAIVAALATMVVMAVRPSAGVVKLFRVLMLGMVAAGVAGVWFHYRGNLEFQLEMDPAQHGLALMLKILHAKAPPALAPGVMAQLGVLGLVYTYRHPLLSEESK